VTTTAAAATTKPPSQATGTAKRAGLDYEDVVVAALQLVETGGAEALSMRKLAAELGVTTTTIYHHVGGRDDLILALIRHLSAQQAEITIEGQNPADRIQSVSEHIGSSA
jgi:AcrR family transcriptional regulator